MAYLELPNPPADEMPRDVNREQWRERRLIQLPFKRSSLTEPLDVIADHATPDGRFILRAKKLEADFGRIGWSVRSATYWSQSFKLLRPVRESRTETVYQMTLPPECWPSVSGATSTVRPLRFDRTKFCVCAALKPGDEFGLGCRSCRDIVRTIVKAHFGLYWPDVVRAVYRRPQRDSSADIDVGKIEPESRGSVMESVAHMMWLHDSMPDFVPHPEPLDELFSTARAFIMHHMSRLEASLSSPSTHFLNLTAKDAARRGKRVPCAYCGLGCTPTATYCEHCGRLR